MDEGEPHGKRRTFARLALDRKLATVPIEDVLDQRETQARAAFSAALRDVDAIETLGQPRQVFRRDAG